MNVVHVRGYSAGAERGREKPHMCATTGEAPLTTPLVFTHPALSSTSAQQTSLRGRSWRRGAAVRLTAPLPFTLIAFTAGRLLPPPPPNRPRRCPAGLSESGSRVYTVTTLHIPDGDHNSPQTCRNSARPYPHGGGSKRSKQLGTPPVDKYTSVAYAGTVVYKHITMQVKA